MANKLLQQQLKNIIRGLTDQDLEKLLTNYEAVSNAKIDKSCRMASYKCYEAAMSYKAWTTNGYGRTESEASSNCIKNFLELVMEDENGLAALIKALKKGSEPAGPTGHHVKGPVERASNVNNTLALNNSLAQVQENNTSFDNRKDIEILSKNIGNISVIGNTKHFGDTVNASQLEMDDLLLKMILEEGVNNAGGVNSLRKSLPPQHPNGIDLASRNSHSNANKGERLSIGGGQSTGETENVNKNKGVLKENSNIYNHAHTHEKEENRYDMRHGGIPPPDHHKPKASGSSKNLENKPHYQRQHSHDGYHRSSGHKEESHHYNEQPEKDRGYKEVSGHGTQKCMCSCSEQLQRANLRIESLEKKLKLLSEENKILKYLAAESKEKGFRSELSTMASLGQTKSPYGKGNDNYELTPHAHYGDVNEFPEKEYSSVQTDKSRSMSMDMNAKKRPEPNSNYKDRYSYNKENNESMEKRDVRKMVPKLNLEKLPNYHAKQPSNSNVLGAQNPNQMSATKGYTHHSIHNPPSYLYSQNSFESGPGNMTISKYIKK